MIPALGAYGIPLLAGLGSLAGLLALRSLLLRVLGRWAARTATPVDDLVLAAVRRPSLGWCAVLGAYLGLSLADLPPRPALVLDRILLVVLILSVTMAVMDLVGRVLEHHIRIAEIAMPASGLVQGVLKGGILVTGLLVVLGVLGISVAPLLTALGVGGLAVALGLQDTLSNLFAGLHILMEKSVRVGDFVRLESGQEGTVVDLTWRTTRIRMLSNNTVIVPNHKLAQSVVTNYDLPERRMSLLIPVSVSYASDPDRVERLLVEEAVQAAPDVPGLLAEPAPFARFIPGYGDSSLDFTLICQVGSFVDQYLAQHELRKRIFRRFAQEGIEIPFPQRTVHLEKE